MTDNIVTLEISTWLGLSLGATHYYGKLCGYNDGEYKCVELKHPLTPSQATRLNKEEQSHRTWRVGVLYPGFDTEDDVIAFSVECFQEHFPAASVLVIGSATSIEPKRIVVPARFDEQSSALVTAVDRLYGGKPDPSSWEELDALTEQYNSLIKSAIKRPATTPETGLQPRTEAQESANADTP